MAATALAAGGTMVSAGAASAAGGSGVTCDSAPRYGTGGAAGYADQVCIDMLNYQATGSNMVKQSSGSTDVRFWVELQMVCNGVLSTPQNSLHVYPGGSGSVSVNVTSAAVCKVRAHGWISESGKTSADSYTAWLS
ncbi:hypothetical protein KSE_11800 [Kitasatospora setae KM-6054]|uniref:Uncharacterized protein n=1 Tax=Kitasatospora setae (strain ATCC 33774 / DSM 43861 / JCM 3304 / KCC A-0304 / NBRC 14216 / KM-6054) TaxID=452652 RepID=E4N732_KITSK|nr:hypothetical protein KSE_11800 [Kitasatospora setae KM-6054]